MLPSDPKHKFNSALASTWAAQAHLPPVQDGLVTETRVGGYEVTKRLGDGEFSTV